MLSIGVGLYLVSGLSATVRCEISALESHATDVAGVLSSYAFTVAGFLATIATFLYTLSDRPYFQLYRRRGSFGDLMFMHGLTMLVLAVLFFVSVFLHSRPELMRIAVVLSAVSLGQLSLITFISYKLSSRTAEATK